MQDFLTPVENTSTYSRTLRTERRLISQQGDDDLRNQAQDRQE